MYQYDPITEYRLNRERFEDVNRRLNQLRLLREAGVDSGFSPREALAGLGMAFERILGRDRHAAAAVAEAEALVRQSEREPVGRAGK